MTADVIAQIDTLAKKAGLLPGGPTLNSNPWSFPKFAGGTDRAPGGLAWIGENGPELMNVPRGAQIIPNDIARRAVAGAGGTSITYNIDAAGADSGTVMKIQQVLSAHARALTGQSKALTSAQRFNATGVG